MPSITVSELRGAFGGSRGQRSTRNERTPPRLLGDTLYVDPTPVVAVVVETQPASVPEPVTVVTPVVVAVVPFVRHAAPADWPRRDRGDLSADLARVGTDITLLSDARELLGLPRISALTAEQRRTVAKFVRVPRMQAALLEARERRAWYLAALAEVAPATVREAARLLELRKGLPQLRLGELSALFAQVRVIEITRPAVRPASEPAREYSAEEVAAEQARHPLPEVVMPWDVT